MSFDQDLNLIPVTLSDVPIQDRAKFARVKMVVEETKRKWNQTHVNPWCAR